MYVVSIFLSIQQLYIYIYKILELSATCDLSLTQASLLCSRAKTRFVSVLSRCFLMLPHCSLLLSRCSLVLSRCSLVLSLSPFLLFSCDCVFASLNESVHLACFEC